MTRAIFLFSLTLCGTLAGQQFDVVSIKPDNSGRGGSSESTGPGRVTAENIDANSLIEQAFGVKAFQISGAPGWVTSERYDLNAATGTSKDLNDKELRPYFLAMLTDRFHLKFHRETREMRIYSLVAAKGGAKLTAHEGGGDTSTHISNSSGRVAMTSTNCSMANFTGIVGRRLDRTVVDNTGLAGSYDITLAWAPNPSPDSTDPSLFTALEEQLGLKLESAKGPVEIIAVESIERPTEN